jgi:hypothetical protein
MKHELKNESMVKAYPVEYRDENGMVKTILYSYGTKLRVTLRGVQFEGDCLANFAPITETDLSLLSQFPPHVLDRDNWLEYFTMHITIPITVVTDEEQEEGAIVELEITPDPNIYSVFLTFRQHQHHIRSLEYGLDPNHTQIPHIQYVKTCINCAYGTYNPLGNEDNWDMRCFRYDKTKYHRYLAQYGWKKAIFALIGDETFQDLQTQETYCCDEFEKRQDIP